jgi:lysozyme
MPSEDSTDKPEESAQNEPTVTQPQTENKPKPPQPPTWNSLITEFEGFREKAYWDETGKVWTIGKGSTRHPDGRPIKRGDTIKKEQVDQYMQSYVNDKIIPVLSKQIPNWNQMNPNQQSSLISFGYNVGPNFYGSPKFETITKALSNQENWSQVPDALKLYNKSNGVSLPGLVRRRAAEANLWLMK